MRIALVSPYSWTYPGGVTRHIEALAGQFAGEGHDVRVLSPSDPPDRHSARLHRGHAPQVRETPDYVVPLGRTIGFPANGAVSNVAITPACVSKMRHELRHGAYDVVHLHEPVAPILGWDAAVSTGAPLVGTFHCYSENVISNNVANVLGARRVLNKLHVRIAVSEAAAWTGRRFFGGHYRIIPNGVDLGAGAPAAKSPGETLRILFVGQAVERKGLPVLIRAFEALREHVPAELRIVGAREEDIAHLVVDRRGIKVLGKVDDETKHRELAEADVLCAPSLGGESFGMVLTEAFAAGTPVIASDIAGYRDVLTNGVQGVLVPRGDATALAEALLDLAHEPERIVSLGAAAAESAERYAWPRVAAEVLDSYEEAGARARAPRPRARALAERIGAAPADGEPRQRARRLPTLEPALTGRRRPGIAAARRFGVAAAALGGVALSFLALERIGIDSVAQSLINSSLPWVLFGLGLMCVSMASRGVAWHAILRAALPGSRVRLADALQGTFIGVLMSATLPARLGEPSRAIIVARRSGRPRDNLPVVLGTLVSQTLLNLVALLVLGIVMFSSVDLFHGHHNALLAFSIAPLAVVAVVLIAPTILGRGTATRSAGVRKALVQARAALGRVRTGLVVFRNPRLGATATLAQLAAWALQWVACYVLLVALGLEHQAGVGAAAAGLFAVNVTAVLPATPSNLGVFQAACVAILHGGYHVSSADALGYGIVLQAVEIATAVIMGGPALVKEGLSWKDVKLRAMHTAPVTLPVRSKERRSRAEVEA
jgi:phosphatidylinositol alpha-mannosyltransferase